MSGVFNCPFCGYKDSVEYSVLLHLEVHHSEGKSPFVADEEQTAAAAVAAVTAAAARSGVEATVAKEELTEYYQCPVKSCGEILHLARLDDHLELHNAEDSADGSNPGELETGVQPSSSSSCSSSMRAQAAAVPGPSRAKPGVPAGVTPNGIPLSSTGGPHVKPSKPVRRLGKKELGAYYNEERMPRWLEDLLKKRGYKSSQGVIPVLAQLLQQNKYTQYAYLCHPETQHISKLRNEGSFCGYRNIQMMISYIVNTGAPGAIAFRNTIPSIFQIQDLIEKGWDQGIHEEGRIELGSLRGTRKYIGTPEAQTLLASLNIQWDMQTFKNLDGDPPSASENRMYDAVEQYFATAPGVNMQSKVRNTRRPPIYLQHQGHSMTIIGIERQPSGNRNLLVFDPSFADPANITRHIDNRRPVEHSHPDRALKLYRRGPRYFSKYHAFELMRLKG
ncbi:DUF1671-domain-containing protein [Daldinia eschscholtzii]|nr:DUF1671-domain-containing protein [Daldinia eschscholtzii]